MSSSSEYRPRRKKKKMKESEFSDEDRISKLPDPLLHHIFSFLDMKFVIQNSVLSRRWRYLWISQPIMNFNQEIYNPSMNSTDAPYNLRRDAGFHIFVESALLLHSTSKIHTFRLSCNDVDQETRLFLVDWMPLLNRRKIEVIELQINFTMHHSILELPECLFRCKSLTTMKFDFSSANGNAFLKIVEDDAESAIRMNRIRSPLPKLKTLHLKSVWLLGGVNSIISMCSALETLVICNCSVDWDYDVSISHSQVKHLVLDRLECCKRLTMNTPNLTSFICRDYPIYDYYYLSIRSPVKADIDIDYSWRTVRPYYDSESSRLESLDTRHVLNCLGGLQYVRFLTLSACLLESIIQVPSYMQSWQVDHCNLRCLTLRTSLSTCQIHATMSFLVRCPNLETLVLKRTEPPRPHECVGEVKIKSEEKEEFWEAKLVPKCLICRLKYFEIWDVQGSVNELEFLKFLLKNAVALEKMQVHIPKKQSNDNEEALRRFGERLKSFQGASSWTTLLFL